MLLLLDNHDSFTFNLFQYLSELGAEVQVHLSDKISLEQIEDLSPRQIVISPGPCTPNEAGISIDLIRRFKGRVPILGVCLGHQAIVAALGGRIVPAKKLVHGKTSLIHHDGKGLYKGCANPFLATRYHSLAVEKDSLPAELMVTAWTEYGEIMGICDPQKHLHGVQFHPESILTVEGKKILRNFLNLC